MKKSFKKFLALCMCATMILSVGVVSNAASFSFYVDAAGNSAGISSYVAKTGTTSYATVNLTTLQFNGSSGLYTKVRKSTTTASNTVSTLSTGTYKPTYKSGYAVAGSNYNLYSYTAASCGYGANMKGTWTP